MNLCFFKLGTANCAGLTKFRPIFWFLYSSGIAVDLCLLGPPVCERGIRQSLVLLSGCFTAATCWL